MATLDFVTRLPVGLLARLPVGLLERLPVGLRLVGVAPAHEPELGQEPVDAALLVGPETPVVDREHGERPQEHDGRQVARAGAGDEQHREEDRDAQERRAEVGLFEDERHGQQREPERRPQPPKRLVAGAEADEPRQGQDQRQLHELAGLEVETEQREPAARLVAYRPRDEDERQQEQVEGVDEIGAAHQRLVGNEQDHRAGGGADDDPGDLAQVPGALPLAGHEDLEAAQHDDAEDEEQRRGHEDRPVQRTAQVGDDRRPHSGASA
jgi:hypothetical protein